MDPAALEGEARPTNAFPAASETHSSSTGALLSPIEQAQQLEELSKANRLALARQLDVDPGFAELALDVYMKCLRGGGSLKESLKAAREMASLMSEHKRT
jgi:hypothetical protein